MDEQSEKYTPEEPAYVPRPRWQIWGARIGLVMLIILIILYYINIARGGV